MAVLFRRLRAGVVNVRHDLGELVLGVVEAPRVAGGVLLHFQPGGGHAAGIGRLARRVQHPGLLECQNRLRGAGHVGALGDRDETVAQQRGGGVPIEFVLGGARQGDIHRNIPDRTAGHEGGSGAAADGVVGDSSAFDLLDLPEQLQVDAGLVDHVSARIRAGDHLGAELLGLRGGVDRDIARAGDRHRLAVEAQAASAEHAIGEHHESVAGGLGAHQRTTPGQALAGQHAGVIAIGDPAVLAEHVADLASADPDVTGGNVGLRTDVVGEFGHERLAEAHDLAVGTPVRVEVGATLAAADRQPRQRVFEDLLEAQELDDAQIHGGVET